MSICDKCQDCFHRIPSHIIDGGKEYESYTCKVYGVEIKEDSTSIRICDKFKHHLTIAEGNNIERLIKAMSICSNHKCWDGCPYYGNFR